jgi:hypothetical protein
MEILEELRIGNLSKTDLQAAQRTMVQYVIWAIMYFEIIVFSKNMCIS